MVKTAKRGAGKPHLSNGNTAPAAGSLTRRMNGNLTRLASLILAHAEALNRRFLLRLEKMDVDVRAVAALLKLTPGAAAEILKAGGTVDNFFEQVEYNGRRLVKLNVPPVTAAEALRTYAIDVRRSLRPPPVLLAVLEHLCSGVLLTLNNAYYQVREAEAQALFALFHGELLSRDLDDLLSRSLAPLQEYCRADSTRIYLLAEGASLSWMPSATSEEQSGARRAVRAEPEMVRALMTPRCFDPRRQPHAIDPRWASLYRTCWSLPLFHGGSFAGVLQFAFYKDYAWLPRERELLGVAVERFAMAVEKARLLQDLARSEQRIRQLARRMIRAEELERRRIGRELHDETGQSLLCIRLQLETLEEALTRGNLREGNSALVGSRIRETRVLTELTIVEMRRFIAALSPSALEQLGLGAAIRQLVKRFHGVFPGCIELSLGRLEHLSKDVQIVAFRVIQESLHNIAKHSRATNVRLAVRSADKCLRIEVLDNGVGFDARGTLSNGNSFGLHSLQERVHLLGGQLEIESSQSSSSAPEASSGTRMTIRIPLVFDAGPLRESEERRHRPNFGRPDRKAAER
jgi:signal transduction histidine kinase